MIRLIATAALALAATLSTVTAEAGVKANGLALNGYVWNGLSLNGYAWNSRSFQGVSWNGTDATGLQHATVFAVTLPEDLAQ